MVGGKNPFFLGIKILVVFEINFLILFWEGHSMECDV